MTTKPTINSFSQMGELIVQKYGSYLPTAFDESMTLLQKVNMIIEYLNQTGDLVNDVVTQWNTVYEWVMNDGLTEEVNAKLNTMANDGTLSQIINVDMIGTLSNLQTTSKSNLVSAINENVGRLNSLDLEIDTQNETLSLNSAKVEAFKNLLGKNPYSPVNKFFGWTGEVNVSNGGSLDTNKSLEAFVVKDGSQYRMFYSGYITASQELACLDAIADDLTGPWTKRNINLAPNNARNRHKMVILVDETGQPVRVNNKYHAYVVGFPSKQIYHWESNSLSSGWVETGLVIDKNHAGNGSDGYGADAPYALWYDNRVILYYMAMPSVSQPDYGLAHRINRSVSNNPASGFTYHGVACTPSPNTGEWYHGWLGGSQVRMSPDGSFWIAFNASSTRPTQAGKEDYPSLWGMATANTPYETWKVMKTPKSELPEQFGVNALTPQPIETENVWRPHLQFSDELGCWMAFNNSGGINERITHELEGKLFFKHDSDGIQGLTTTDTKVAATKVKLPKGFYRIHFQLNLMSGGSGEIPKLDVVVRGKYNSLALPNHTVSESKFFIGSYAYENTNANLNFPLKVPHDNAEIYFSVQVVGGTPTATSRVRNSKVFIEQI